MVLEKKGEVFKLGLIAIIVWVFVFGWTGEAYAGSTLPYTDIRQDAYYADAVKWACENGIAKGVTETEFCPDAPCSRGAFVTFLWRAVGCPQPKENKLHFDDIFSSHSAYRTAIIWAVEQRITDGVEESYFMPDQTVDRAQTDVFLYRYYGKESHTMTACSFPDVDSGQYYYDAVLWAIEKGIAKGISDTKFSPNGVCTRGQVITFLYRAFNSDSTALKSEFPTVKVDTDVILNGKFTDLYQYDGRTYVRAADLANAFSDFSWFMNGNQDTVSVQFRGKKANLTVAADRDYYEAAGGTADGILLSGNREPALSLDVLKKYFSIITLTDSTEGTMYIGAGLNTSMVPSGRVVPVLEYHCISNMATGLIELYTPIALFEGQLKYLLNNGYQPIFFSDLERLDQYKKPILITLDDGYQDNYDNLFPILKKYNAKATIFMIGNFFGRNLYMTAEEAREMTDSGLVSFQSHTCSHKNLDILSETEQRNELEKSRLQIAKATGQIPYVLSYPEGRYTNTTLKLAGAYYSAAVETGNALFTTGAKSWYCIPRVSVPNGTTVEKLAKKLSGK